MESAYRNGSLISEIINLQLYGLRYFRELYASSNSERYLYGNCTCYWHFSQGKSRIQFVILKFHKGTWCQEMNTKSEDVGSQGTRSVWLAVSGAKTVCRNMGHGRPQSTKILHGLRRTSQRQPVVGRNSIPQHKRWALPYRLPSLVSVYTLLTPWA